MGLTSRFGLGLLPALAAPQGARAVQIDGFSAGGFNLEGRAGGAAGTYACGSSCLGGSRTVFAVAQGFEPGSRVEAHFHVVDAVGCTDTEGPKGAGGVPCP
jgi:sugar/nucleoside kinase (ribokinase family)